MIWGWGWAATISRGGRDGGFVSGRPPLPDALMSPANPRSLPEMDPAREPLPSGLAASGHSLATIFAMVFQLRAVATTPNRFSSRLTHQSDEALIAEAV